MGALTPRGAAEIARTLVDLEVEGSLRVHVPNIWVLGIWVIVILVQFWGKSMMIGYLEPWRFRDYGVGFRV